MNRLYVIESTPTLTGMKADHRLVVRSSEIADLARALAAAVGVPGIARPAAMSERAARFVTVAARDLLAHRGRGLVLAGETEPPIVHAIAHAINELLGNAGRTVGYIDPVEVAPVDQLASLKELAADMEAGRVELLVIAGTNPVWTAPVDLEFAARLERVPLRVHFGLFADETAERCHWHIPAAHLLEAWSDARAYDGTVSIVQPLIAPLYGGRSIHELVAALTTQPDRSGYELVQDFWRRAFDGAVPGWGPFARPDGGAYPHFEAFWRRSVHDGVVRGTAAPLRSVQVRLDDVAGLAARTPSAEQRAAAQSPPLELVFRPDPAVYDGRFANNAWLQELPRPLTSLTWDNAALVSPALAARLGLATGDIVELRLGGRAVQAPVLVQPGQPADSVTVHVGQGRRRGGRVATGVGFDAYRLRSSEALWSAHGLEIRKTGRQTTLARAQLHHGLEGRSLVRVGTLEEFRERPDFARARGHAPEPTLSLYPEHPYDGHAWGMVIDLGACIGCQACIVACQAENNIPVVGKSQVAIGREMHWLRVDTYYTGSPDDPQAVFQPVPCMHCERAPCEPVCPVGATVHSDEGLNDQVYNRCIGTRYCANNCPYKVRRFNFLLYADWTTPTLKLLRNPDVTVRSRGVMEKCTYCVQRINEAKIAAAKDDRAVRDGEIQTACQQVCPTRAIVFGDINDPTSQVARLKAEPLNYGLLEELNTRPRTTYLALVRNPHPDLEAPKEDEA